MSQENTKTPHKVTKTMYFCKTKCWNCDKEINIAYIILCAKDRQILCPPNCFSPKEIKLAKENNIAIRSNQYGCDLITANACPHCGELFGNNHIKELAGTEYKKIENVQELCKENIVIIK